MRGKRFLWFLVMIAAGVLLGLVYGWVIQPIGGSATTPKALRYDYQADYVLMAAEIYAADGDRSQAARRLATISDQDPAQTAAAGLQSARALDWADADLDTLEHLVQALQGQNVIPKASEQP